LNDLNFGNEKLMHWNLQDVIKVFVEVESCLGSGNFWFFVTQKQGKLEFLECNKIVGNVKMLFERQEFWNFKIDLGPEISEF
jgi:hypothetical protein